MKPIDEMGRLFGKINVIDFVVVLEYSVNDFSTKKCTQ